MMPDVSRHIHNLKDRQTKIINERREQGQDRNKNYGKKIDGKKKVMVKEKKINRQKEKNNPDMENGKNYDIRAGV